MRKPLLLVSLTALAACSGGGPQTAGGTAAVGGATPTPTTTDSFVNPTQSKTYSAIGGVQSYKYSTDGRDATPAPGHQNVGQYDMLYAANASTARNSGITITYNPRDAIFDIKIADTAAGVNGTYHMQDPAHRTDFGGAKEPQAGTPDLANKNIAYLEVDSGSTGTSTYDSSQSLTFPIGLSNSKRDRSTFFYQKPGTSTQYVTYAGFVRNSTSVVEVTDPNNNKYLRQDHTLERAAFAYGIRTDNANVPKTGSASYSGDMLATMVYNPLIDDHGVRDTYFQWITGTNTTTVDFGANSFNSTFTGRVEAPLTDIYSSGIHAMPAGSTFNATGSGTVDLVSAGGFSGQMTAASFTTPSTVPNHVDPALTDTIPNTNINPNGLTVQNPTTPATANTTYNVSIAGSSIDGAFYGPNANEVGGGFRVVGGTPDERIDILGTFVGKRP